LPPPPPRGSGEKWPSWLRYCAASRKVAGSIPDGVIGTYSSLTRNFSCGQRWPVFRAEKLKLMCRLSRNSGSLNLLKPQEPVHACKGIALDTGIRTPARPVRTVVTIPTTLLRLALRNDIDMKISLRNGRQLCRQPSRDSNSHLQHVNSVRQAISQYRRSVSLHCDCSIAIRRNYR